MKHTIINGKWMPPNGTFVRVPNEQIPEVIRMLRDNGQITEEDDTILVSENCVYFEEGEWGSFISDLIEGKELPFPDFKALVTGKLLESWCIQCTEENMKHEAFTLLCKAVNVDVPSQPINCFVGSKREGNATKVFSAKPFGEVLQIETWAALNPVEESTEKWTPNEEEQKSISKDIRSVTQIGKSTDEQLINELKSRGYTVSKIY